MAHPSFAGEGNSPALREIADRSADNRRPAAETLGNLAVPLGIALAVM
jgi:hypothetical protein